MVDIAILDELKNSDAKNKYLKFPDVATFNKVVDIISGSEEGPKLLESFLKGSQENEAKRGALGKIIDAVEKAMKTAEGPAKEVLQKELEKLEKAVGKGRKVGLNFVLKWLLATNQYEEIQAIAALVE